MTNTEKPSVCVSCGSGVLTNLESKWGYDLYGCSQCLMQFWFPFQTPGNEYYEQSGRFQARNSHPTSKRLYDSQLMFLKENPKPGSTLLDLGMGSGRFLDAAQKRGYVVTGTDFDRTTVDSAKKTFGLTDVYPYDTDTYFEKAPKKHFGIITIFGVLEHLDSFAFMSKIVDALEPNGFFVIDVPNRDCWVRHLDHEGPPLHLTRWNIESMRRFLDRYGLKIVSVHKIPLPFRLIISRFNEWFHGITSFDIVRKIEQQKTASGEMRGRTRASKILRVLSLVKTYVLFAIPALLVWIYLWTTGKIYTELYFITTPKT